MFCFQSRLRFLKSLRYTSARVCHCVCVCVCVCVSLVSDSSETIEVIIIKLGTVTTSDMLMHHVLITLTLTVIQGHIRIINVRLFQKLFKQFPSSFQ